MKETMSVEKYRRIKERRAMTEARTKFRQLLDEEGVREIRVPRSIWKRTVDLTCEEAQRGLYRDYARMNTKRKARDFDQLQQFFHEKYGDAIPLRLIPEGLPTRPDLLHRLYRLSKPSDSTAAHADRVEAHWKARSRNKEGARFDAVE